jgi:hypothetical protein
VVSAFNSITCSKEYMTIIPDYGFGVKVEKSLEKFL